MENEIFDLNNRYASLEIQKQSEITDLTTNLNSLSQLHDELDKKVNFLSREVERLNNLVLLKTEESKSWQSKYTMSESNRTVEIEELRM